MCEKTTTDIKYARRETERERSECSEIESGLGGLKSERWMGIAASRWLTYPFAVSLTLRSDLGLNMNFY